MDKLLDRALEGLPRKAVEPLFEEWALHVEFKNDPSVFCNLLQEAMQSNEERERGTATILARFIVLHSLHELKTRLGTKIPETAKDGFEGAAAAAFYEGLKRGLIGSFRNYVQNFEPKSRSLDLLTHLIVCACVESLEDSTKIRSGGQKGQR